MDTSITGHIDFTKIGFQKAWVRIPHDNGGVHIPLYRFKSKNSTEKSPRVLLTAGNHGDEYEGNLVLVQLVEKLQNTDFTGEITIITALNAPAFYDGNRVSPIDQGNLNRAFPGDAYGTATQRIAHWVEHDLLPQHDYAFDCHAGGVDNHYLLTALAELPRDKTLAKRTVDALKATGLPYGYLAPSRGDAPTIAGAGQRANMVLIAGEFGGQATVTPHTMTLTKRAIDNFLMHTGVLDTPILGDGTQSSSDMTLVSLPTLDGMVHTQREIWFESLIHVSDTVQAGDVIGYTYDFYDLDNVPNPVYAPIDGLVIMVRAKTHAEAGAVLFGIGVVTDESHLKKHIS